MAKKPDKRALRIKKLFDAINDVVDISGAVLKGEQIDPKEFRRVPLLGDLYYNLFGGGAEEFLQKERRERFRRGD